MAVTEVPEAGGFAVRVVGGAEQVQRLLVAFDGLLVAAKVMVDVTETVAGVRLAGEVAEHAENGESLLTTGECLVIVAMFGKVPADVIEGPGLPCWVARGLVMPEALAGMIECFPSAALCPGQPGEG